MTTIIVKIINHLFPSEEMKLTKKTMGFAWEVNKSFQTLSETIKEGEFINAEYQRVSDDNDRFLKDNTENWGNQNVNRKQDIKRAYWLLTGVMLLSSILAVKGLMFFFEEFYGNLSLFIIVPIALILAMVFVIGSIYLNTFAISFREENSWIFYHLKTAAFALILFIPSMNLLEGLNSQYSTYVMALNVIAIVIDIILNTALVTMSNVFIVSENAKSAKKEIMKRTKAKRSADQTIRSFNVRFLNRKNIFANAAKQFTFNFKKLKVISPTAAADILYLCDNFVIWMINNKVFDHLVLPYHTNKDGRPVIEDVFFSPEQDTIRQSFDNLSKVKLYNNNQQPTQPDVLVDIENQQHLTSQEKTTDIDQPQESLETPPDYESFLNNDDTNSADKYL